MKTNNKEFEHYSAPETEASQFISLAYDLNSTSFGGVSIDDLEEDDSFTF
jgi:hypothetical protein